jgi:hypothetical protein
MSQAGTYGGGTITPGTYIQFLESNSGGQVPPDGSGIINIEGDISNNIIGTGMPMTSTIVFGITGATTNAILIGNGSGSLTDAGVGSDGELLIGSTGNPPVLATLTAGSGISITNGAGSITIDNTSTGLTWTEVTVAGPTTMVVNSGYITNNAGSVVELDLPATAAVGSMLRVTGIGAGGWQVNCGTGQTIHYGLLSTTTGTGSLASTETRDGITMVCVVEDTDWNVLDVGNITVV